MYRFFVFICLFCGMDLYAQPAYFPPVAGDTWATTDPESLGFCADQIDSLYAYLEATNTDAFLLLEDGRIVLERYFGDFTAASPHAWNSAGKTMTATAIGIAQREGLLALDDSVSDYLGTGWTSCSPAEEEAITIWHLLTQTSGLNDAVADVYCTEPACLECIAPPGERWAYHNGAYTNLIHVLEAASGQTANGFVNQRIEQLTGIGGAYFANGYNRVYASHARNFARFGVLMQAGGDWDGTPVLDDPAYYADMTTPSQAINPAYGYLWWLNGQSSFRLPGLQLDFDGPVAPAAPADVIAAMGKDGQILNVIPSQNRIWVRFGDNPAGASNFVPTQYLNEIWEQLNALECTTAAGETVAAESITLSPNPAAEILRVESPERLRYAGLYSAAGVRVASPFLLHDSHVAELDLSSVGTGIYFLRLTTAAEAVRWRRVVVAR